MTSWKKLADNIWRPCTKPIMYRETHATVIADDKLWFFGRRGVDSTTGDPMGWRETSLLGGFVSTFDLKTQQWDFKNFDKIDENEKLKEHIFAVNNKIFMLIYSTTECCTRLLVWNHDKQAGKWNDVKLDDSCKCKESQSCRNPIVINAVDGPYIICGGEIYKLDITVQGGDLKHAKCRLLVASTEIALPRPAAQCTALAANKDKMVLWYGEEMCGFWWQPGTPLIGELKSGSNHFDLVNVAEPHPPYGYSGPDKTVTVDNKWIMLGGSKACGLGQSEDCAEIWVFDIDKKSYRKSDFSMIKDMPQYRSSFACDYNTGIVYVCDIETGIYAANLNKI